MAAKRYKPDKRANGGNGVDDSVSTGEVARRLGISSRSVSRLCSTGELVNFRTPGGHIRVRRKDLEEYVERTAVSASAPRVENTRLSGEREETQALSQQLQQRRIKRDLARLDEEDAEAERKRAEAVAAEHARSQAVLDQVRLQHEEYERQRQKEAKFERRQFWVDEQVEFALNSVPSDVASRFASEIQLSVKEAIQSGGPSSPRPLVERLVRAAVDRVVEPWQREQQRKLREAETRQQIASAADAAL